MRLGDKALNLKKKKKYNKKIQKLKAFGSRGIVILVIVNSY